MALRLEKEIAVYLRKQGKTYSEIIGLLEIPKTTLSNWLSGHPLTLTQLKLLGKNKKIRNLLGVEKTTRIKRLKKLKRLEETFKNEKSLLSNLTGREKYLLGLFLYWGEGKKGTHGTIGLNNTDPLLVKFFLVWMVEVLGIPKNRIKVAIHLYKDMNVEKSLGFWSRCLDLSLRHFNKPYIKESKITDVNQVGYGKGTCGLYVCNTRLKEKIMAGISCIARSFCGED